MTKKILCCFLWTMSCCYDSSSAAYSLEPPKFVDDPPTSPSNFYNEDGPPINLKCSIQQSDNVTTVHWYKDGNSVNNDNIYLLKDKNQTLIIREPKQNQSGSYQCVASNTVGNINYTVNILIKERIQGTRPRVVTIIPNNSVMYANLGDKVTISCIFDVGGTQEAVFEFTAEWYKDENNIINDTSHTTYRGEVTDNKNKIFSLDIDKLDRSDYGNYTCFGKNMQGNESKRISVLPPDVSNDKLLPLNVTIIGTVSGCFLVLATLTFALVIRNRHKKKEQITYKELGWIEPDTSNYEVPQHQLQYDVFISYSSEDITWVKNILFQRLLDMGYQVCTDFKDFTPGMAVAENIIDSIYKSRKTIVVMSKSFLKSMWGQFELQQAHNRAILQRQDILILVKFDNSKVPANLMGKTFLDWSDKSVQPHFWNRMYEALGAPESIDLTSNDDCAYCGNSAEYAMASEKCLSVNGTPDEHASAVVETKNDTSELIKENGFSNVKTEIQNTMSIMTTNSPENVCSDNNNASLNKFKTHSSFDDWITVDVCG